MKISCKNKTDKANVNKLIYREQKRKKLSNCRYIIAARIRFNDSHVLVLYRPGSTDRNANDRKLIKKLIEIIFCKRQLIESG